jgi:uncharacterized membrane protein YqjE
MLLLLLSVHLSLLQLQCLLLMMLVKGRLLLTVMLLEHIEFTLVLLVLQLLGECWRTESARRDCCFVNWRFSKRSGSTGCVILAVTIGGRYS